MASPLLLGSIYASGRVEIIKTSCTLTSNMDSRAVMGISLGVAQYFTGNYSNRPLAKVDFRPPSPPRKKGFVLCHLPF
jgi:hypothetical protein